MLDCRVCLAPLTQGSRWWHDDAKEFPHHVDLSCLKSWLLACKKKGAEPLCPVCFSEVKVIHEERSEETVITRVSELAASVIKRRREKIEVLRLARQNNDFDAIQAVIRDLSPPSGFRKTDTRMSGELLRASRKLFLEGHLEIAQLLAETGCLTPGDALKVMEFIIVRLKNEELALVFWASVHDFINADRVLMDALHNDFWAFARTIIQEKPIERMSKLEALGFAVARNRREIIDLLLVKGTLSVPLWVWTLVEERAESNGFPDLVKFLQTKREAFVLPS